MKVHDISVELKEDMIKYPSLAPIEHTILKDYSKGDDYSVSKVNMVLHLGTHLDSPYHYVNGGKKMADIPLDTFYGDVILVETNEKCITKEFLEKCDLSCKRVIIKTPFSHDVANHNVEAEQSYFSQDAADYLVEQKMLFVGGDYCCVDKIPSKEKPIHRTLLGGGCIIMEGAYLENMKIGKYYLYALPLRINEAEGSPTRAILIEE